MNPRRSAEHARPFSEDSTQTWAAPVLGETSPATMARAISTAFVMTSASVNDRRSSFTRADCPERAAAANLSLDTGQRRANAADMDGSAPCCPRESELTVASKHDECHEAATNT
jgi:hypothetical protein